MTLRFLGADGETGQALTIGPVTAADRDSTSQMLPRAASAAVPVRTRALSLTITATRFAGTYDDGYADNVSLSLTGPAAPVTQPGCRPRPRRSPPSLPRRCRRRSSTSRSSCSRPARCGSGGPAAASSR